MFIIGYTECKYYLFLDKTYFIKVLLTFKHSLKYANEVSRVHFLYKSGVIKFKLLNTVM